MSATLQLTPSLGFIDFEDELVNTLDTWRAPRFVVAKPQGTDVTTTELHQSKTDSKFAPHFARLSAIETDSKLWPVDVEGPSSMALAWGHSVLQQLRSDKLAPTRVVASGEGGVAICFIKGKNYCDIECLNDGKILGVTSNRRDRPTAWEVEPSASGIASASTRIRTFLKGG